MALEVTRSAAPTPRVAGRCKHIPGEMLLNMARTNSAVFNAAVQRGPRPSKF